MGRKATGTVRILRGPSGKPQWHGRWTRADTTRSDWLPLNAPIAVEACCYVADPECAHRRQAKAETARLAPSIFRESMNGGAGETFAQYADRWLKERATRLVTIKDDVARLRDHITPLLGHLAVQTFTRDDVEGVRDALDKKVADGEISWKTATNVWALLRTLCDDTANARKRELRVRADSPRAGIKPPLRGAKREKQYLYPSEFLKVVSCRDVPRVWRRAIALALYTYGRDGEVASLDCAHVHLEHHVLRITQARNRETGEAKSTKTGGTRRFSVEPNLMPLLGAMHSAAGGKGKLFDFDATHLSRTFRRWLKVAKVDRAELHEPTETTRPITWHDLRASAATWMAIRGDKPLAIRDRCGHASFSTTEIYIREAEVLVDGFGEPFPPLPEELFPPLPAGVRNNAPIAPGAFQNSRNGLKQGGSGAGHGSRRTFLLDPETRGKESEPASQPLSETPDSRPPQEPAAVCSTDSRPLTTTRGADLTEAELEVAIARLTRRLATAPDEEIVELVAERRSMRDDLERLRRGPLPDNVRQIRSATTG